VRGLQLWARALPRSWALATFAALGHVVRLVDRPAARRTRNHLEIAFAAEKKPAERARLERGMFREMFRNLVDLLRPFPTDSRRVEALVRFEGLAHLDAALRAGRGVVALSAHLGNWEVLGAALAARGYPISVVAREVFDTRSDRVLNDWRARAGVRVHPRTRGLFGVVRDLRAGRIVGTLVDQDTGGPSVFVDFFGRAARTPSAPFVLARRTGACLVPMWVHMEPDGRHVVEIRSAIARSRLDLGEAAILADVAAWHRELEAAIRAHPEQWVWHHRRWKTRPQASVTDLRTFSRNAASVPPERPTREAANRR
jgi:KDO2-lipid IV(A) lauroyltransferase